MGRLIVETKICSKCKIEKDIENFRLKKAKEDIFNLCHYTNLQLLKAEDNLKKGAKLDCELFGNWGGDIK